MPKVAAEVKWGEDNGLEAVPVLSDEDKFAIRERVVAMDKLLAEQKKAKYKIEIFFTQKRTTRGHFPGAISLWESGTKAHGGGDTKLYECPGRFMKVNDCTGFIPDVSNGYGFLVCPTCGKMWKGEQVLGETLARLTHRGWAELLLKYYVRLGHNADLYLKYPRQDLRAASALEQGKQHMGEKLAKARTRERHLYPLGRIIKDVSAGADILGRFYAFLTA